MLAHVPARRFHLAGARFEFMRAKSKPPDGLKPSPDIVESHEYKRGFRTSRSVTYEQSVKCPGSLSFDHRVVNGAGAAAFLQEVKAQIGGFRVRRD